MVVLFWLGYGSRSDSKIGVSFSFVFIGSGGSTLPSPFQHNPRPDNVFMSLSKHPDFWRSPGNIVPEEIDEAS